MQLLNLLALLIASTVVLNAAQIKEVSAISLPAVLSYSGEAPANSFADHAIRQEFHNHVDRQSLDRVLQNVRANQPFTEHRSLKKVHQSAKKLATTQQLYYLPLN